MKQTFYSTLFSEMAPQLYMEAEMPEAPKASFLVGLFGGGTKSFDREELCTFELN